MFMQACRAWWVILCRKWDQNSLKLDVKPYNIMRMHTVMECVYYVSVENFQCFVVNLPEKLDS